MDPEQTKNRAAQPADEELKKHGDQLKKQVDAVAGEPRTPDNKQVKDGEARKD